MFEKRDHLILRPSLAEYSERITKDLVNVCESYQNDVIAVLHGNINYAILNRLSNVEDPGHFDNCGLVVLGREGNNLYVIEDHKNNSELNL